MLNAAKRSKGDGTHKGRARKGPALASRQADLQRWLPVRERDNPNRGKKAKKKKKKKVAVEASQRTDGTGDDQAIAFSKKQASSAKAEALNDRHKLIPI